MAPVVARMPCSTPAPSKAGPAEQAHASSQSRLPSTISPLVPTSRNSVSCVCLQQPGADGAGADIGADVAGDTGQAVHCGLRMDVQAQFGRLDARRLVDGRDEGRQPDGLRRQPQKQVDHGAVAGHGRLVDLARLHVGALRRLRQETVEGLQDKVLQFGQPVVLAGVDDA